MHNLKKNTLKNKNGLPLEIKYCKKCNISNQQPTTTNEYFHNLETVQSHYSSVRPGANYYHSLDIS